MKRQSDIGWFELIMGLILIILGIVIMRQPVGVLTWIVILCGVIAVISGIGDIVLYVKMERFTGFGPVVSLVTGILGIMAGFISFPHPGAGLCDRPCHRRQNAGFRRTFRPDRQIRGTGKKQHRLCDRRLPGPVRSGAAPG